MAPGSRQALACAASLACAPLALGAPRMVSAQASPSEAPTSVDTDTHTAPPAAPTPRRWGHTYVGAFALGVRTQRHRHTSFAMELSASALVSPRLLPRLAFGVGVGTALAPRARGDSTYVGDVRFPLVIGVGADRSFRDALEFAFAIEPRLTYGRVEGERQTSGFGFGFRFVPGFALATVSVGVERYRTLGEAGHVVSITVGTLPYVHGIQLGSCGGASPIRDD